jgi:hypothetical protein
MTAGNNVRSRPFRGSSTRSRGGSTGRGRGRGSHRNGRQYIFGSQDDALLHYDDKDIRPANNIGEEGLGSGELPLFSAEELESLGRLPSQSMPSDQPSLIMKETDKKTLTSDGSCPYMSWILYFPGVAYSTDLSTVKLLKCIEEYVEAIFSTISSVRFSPFFYYFLLCLYFYLLNPFNLFILFIFLYLYSGGC